MIPFEVAGLSCVSRWDWTFDEAPESDVSDAGFRRLAEFRHRIRLSLHFSEDAARSRGTEPQQHQLLLALKGLPRGIDPTVTALAHQLCPRHHSAVELLNRLEEHGAIICRHCEDEVLVGFSALGEDLLHRLWLLHYEEPPA